MTKVNRWDIVRIGKRYEVEGRRWYVRSEPGRRERERERERQSVCVYVTMRKKRKGKKDYDRTLQVKGSKSL
jgi:hypothetical protein